MTVNTVLRAPDEPINGRPASELLAALPDRISRAALQWAEREPDRPALVDGDVSWSYAELGAAIRGARDLLRSLDVRPGDRIMVLNENSRALIALLLGAAELDVWVAVVSARLSAKEVDTIAGAADPRRLLYTTGVSPEAAAHADRHGAQRRLLPDLGEIAVGLLRERAEPEPVHASGRDQVATLIFTSGTTGVPKGVMLTHRNMLTVAAFTGGLRELGAGDRVYGVLPISHVFGLSSVFLGTLFYGATLQLEARFEPARLAEALEHQGVTVVQGVPAMFQRLLEYLRVQGRELRAPFLRYMSVGGAPLDPAVKERVEQAFGLPLNNGYGLTEAAPTISQTRIHGPHDTISTGPVLPLLEYQLKRDQADAENDPEVGELWVRGPTVMKGYFRRPEATAEVLTADGWLNTGDLARLDGQGNLYIVGRTKELIIRSGFNVYPPDVEAVITEHPDVTLCAVVGRAVEGNEEVVAYVQLVPGSMATATEIRAFASERLAPYKRPSEVVIMDSLPATPTGKILKARLRQQSDKQ
ncbi:MAG: AMP-binding protein [Ectothiorhodospiraceae bacterium]|nr:AMP-binding protein [Ectothiorhodospiraceae bacterium]